MSVQDRYLSRGPIREIDYLPVEGVLKNGCRIYLDKMDFNNAKDVEDHRNIISEICKEGIYYPFVTMDEKEHADYFLGGDVFILKVHDTGEQIGSFYIKPFYAGRSAHLCNAIFAVKQSWRGQSAVQFMIKAYLKLAPDLGYRGSYFTLVYETNVAAIAVYRKHGFRQVGTIPKAGYLKDVGFVDAFTFYKDLIPSNNEP